MSRHVGDTQRLSTCCAHHVAQHVDYQTLQGMLTQLTHMDVDHCYGVFYHDLS